MRADLLHLSRNLRRAPASAGAAILTLSLTLGAGASIVAVVHDVLLTPLPFADPDALVAVGEVPIDEPGGAARRPTYATIENWRDRARPLATLEAFEGTNLTLTELGAADRVTAVDVTPGFFALLGTAPALGRPFGQADVGHPVVLLSHGFWVSRFASDPGVVGRRIMLAAQPHLVVGVLPERVQQFDPADLWRPVQFDSGRVSPGFRMNVVARLAANAPPAALTAALDEVSRDSSPRARVIVTPLATAVAGGATKPLGVLAGVAGLAVLIAFTNLAGLLIVRSIDRRRELAIRHALGAPRRETIKQLLLEAQALVAIGTAAGVLLALWMTPFVGRLALQQIGALRTRDVSVDWQVIAVVAIAASVCAGICALWPAVIAERRSTPDILRRGASSAPREVRSRRFLVSAEVALAFVLLVSVGLLGRNLAALIATDPGFDARGVLKLQVSLPAAAYPDGRVVTFYSALERALDERLGTRSAAIVSEIPLAGSLRRHGVGFQPGDARAEAVMREASRAYFDVMRIPIVAGRSFTTGDDASAPLRGVISQSLATQVFASDQPIGRRLWLQNIGSFDVIGVVGDVKHGGLDDGFQPTVYLAPAQSASRSNNVVVRSNIADADVLAVVREEVARLDRDLPIYGVRWLEDVVAGSRGVPERRVLTATFMGFALLALVLSATGLFGVVAHDVASRRTELAVRMALGAEPSRILRGTFTQTALMMASGLAAGGVLTLWAARVLGSAGYASGLDPLSVGASAAVLVAAGAVAVFPAARRAAGTDPLTVLRGD